MLGAPLVKRGLLGLGHYRRALRRSRFPGVAVLGYHGLRADDWPEGSMAFENLHVRASTFDAHCRVIRDTCDPISLDDWRAAIAGTAPLPPRPVLITFDDGYRSVFTIGAPVLAGAPVACCGLRVLGPRWSGGVCCGSTIWRRGRARARSRRGRRARTPSGWRRARSTRRRWPMTIRARRSRAARRRSALSRQGRHRDRRAHGAAPDPRARNRGGAAGGN